MRNRERKMTWSGPKTICKNSKRKNIWLKTGQTMFRKDRSELNGTHLKALDGRKIRTVGLPLVNMYEGE